MPAQVKQKFDLIGALIWIRGLKLPSGEKSIMYSLATRMDKTGTCFPGIKCLGLDSGYKNAKSVSRTLSQLKKKGLVTVEPRNKGYSNKQTNIYSFPEFQSTKEKTKAVKDLSEQEQIEWVTSLVTSYTGKTISYKMMAKFWYSLRDEFYPLLPKKSLSKYVQKAVREMVGWCNSDQSLIEPITIFSVIGVGYFHWDDLRSKFQCGNVSKSGGKLTLPKYPTPVSLRDYFEEIYQEVKE